jgi:dipeptidyl aminopeptidase/acylaminoacyl peptidase
MKKTLAFIFALCFIFEGYTQSISDYLSVPFPSAMTVSPDGKQLAWVFSSQGERNIYLATSPTYQAKKLTDYKGDNGIDLGELTFSPDGNWLAYVRGNGKNRQGEAANPALVQENTEQQVFVLDLKKNESKMLGTGTSPIFHPDSKKLVYLRAEKPYMTAIETPSTSSAPLFQHRGSLSQLQWSPDGKWLAFSSNRTDHAFVGLFHLENKEITYPETSLDHDSYPSWSPDGKYLAYLRIPNINQRILFSPIKETNPWSIRVLDVTNMEAKEVFRAKEGIGSLMVRDLPAQNERLWWSSQGELVFPWENNGWVQLYSVNTASEEVQRLMPGSGMVEKVQTSFQPDELLITSNNFKINGRQVVRIDLKSKKVELLSNLKENAWSPLRTADGLAYIQSSTQKPAWPMVRTAQGEKVLAESLFPNEFPKSMSSPQYLEIKAKDDFVSYAYLYLPKDYQEGKKYPAVIFLHGGSRRQMLEGFNYGLYYSNADAMQQYFASKGFIALTLNYRSGIGYGIHFREAENYGATGASEVSDVMAAADYLASRSDVNKSQIIPWGGSYGGYLTAHALSQAPGKFLAGVDIHGVHNWNPVITNFNPWYQAEKFPEAAELAFKSSPLYHVANWKEPVLLITGDDDRNVPVSESVELLEILRKQGVEVEQLVFPDEVHSFLLHQNWVKAYEATFDFIKRQIQKQEEGDTNP